MIPDNAPSQVKLAKQALQMAKQRLENIMIDLKLTSDATRKKYLINEHTHAVLSLHGSIDQLKRIAAKYDYYIKQDDLK